ncbi:hypothetical protein GCM10009765_54650 [Fodinicola feengrottensis]|uniref:Uncharacterized protein n=1 Tax=Fodinicola feengrottensis TaxID=435914 RepID=A0ABP4U6T4_9ACTN
MTATFIAIGLVVLAAIGALVIWRRAVTRRAAARDAIRAEQRTTTYDGRYGDAAPAGQSPTAEGGVTEAAQAAEIARSQASATIGGMSM